MHNETGNTLFSVLWRTWLAGVLFGQRNFLDDIQDIANDRGFDEVIRQGTLRMGVPLSALDDVISVGPAEEGKGDDRDRTD